jgi:hypothetical protein
MPRLEFTPLSNVAFGNSSHRTLGAERPERVERLRGIAEMQSWIFGILVSVFLILIVLWMIGSQVVNLPKTHDPFPLAVRTQIDTLNDARREIGRLAVKARMFGKEADLSQERQNYDELAAEADDWLKTARDGLELGTVDAPFLSKKFEEELSPKAKELAAKLKLKQPIELGAADFDHIISAFEKGWDDVKSFIKLALASHTESIRIAINQLDDIKWQPWSELKATLF